MKSIHFDGNRRAACALVAGAIVVLSSACGTGKPSQGSLDTPSASGAPGETQALSAAVSAVNTPDPSAAPFVGATPGSGKGMIVGYISAGESSPFVHSLTLGMQAQAARAGMTLRFCDAQFDATKALQCAKNLTSQGVQGLFNMQTDNKAAPAICKVGGPLPTIALAIHQKPCENSFVGINDEHAGEMAGKAMGVYIKARFDCKVDKIFSLEQASSGTTNEQRVAGWTKGYQATCGSKDHFQHLESGGVSDKAERVVTDALTAAPEAKRVVVFAIDDDAASGALAAASIAGRSNALFMASQGGDDSAHCKILQDPQWVADIGYFPERYGEIAVPAMVTLLKGEKIKTVLNAQLSAFNKTNVEQFYPGLKC